MFQPLKFLFCTTKNYTSTFKIRSRLAQFFKHVHPDQLNQASKTIKQENLRSLTNLNAYIDCINHTKPSESKLLKFYMAEKTNNKSKKFYSFSIQLPEISSNGGELTEERAKKLIDNIVDVLNSKFKQSKNLNNKIDKVVLKKDQQINQAPLDKPTQQQRFHDLSSTIKPFKKKNHIQQQQLTNSLNAVYMNAQKDSLSAKLKKNISFADTSTNKPMMWSRMAAQQSGLYKDMQHILDSLIDPRLIYFDESLKTTEIDEFKKRLLPGSMDRAGYKKTQIIMEFCEKIQSFNPPICLFVSKQYSATKIPGFFTIPYNFQAIQLAKKYQESIETVLNQQQKFQKYHDYYVQLASELRKNNGLYIDQQNFKNNQDIWMRILALKRLQKYNFRDLYRQDIKGILFDKEYFEIFKQNYQITNKKTVMTYKNKLICLVEFIQNDLQQIFTKLQSQNHKTE